MTEKLEKRLADVEDALTPRPVNIAVYYSTDCPFPLEWDKDDAAKRFAWSPVEESWHEARAAEAEKAYDRTKYYDFRAVIVLDELSDPEHRLALFREAIATDRLKIEDYRIELESATAWAKEQGLPPPVNLAGPAQEEPRA